MSGIKFPEQLLRSLAAAQRVTVLTGAGISAESGVPTFRQAQTGLWARYRPEELATPHAFEHDPARVWEWYTWRRGLVEQAQPNPAHHALAEMERQIPIFTLITQNVDSLHQRAGSHNVLELHGNISRNKCFRENIVVETWEDTGKIPPRCPRCGGPVRPDVVWFGEALPEHVLDLAWQATENCDLFFSAGTSGIVHPAASLPYLALQRGIPVVEVNPHETPLTGQATYHLNGPAGAILPALVKSVWG